MSWHEYLSAQEINNKNPPFFALIMAAILKADPDNKKLLQRAFPVQYEEVKQREAAPGGKLHPFEKAQMHLRLGVEEKRR